MNKKNLLMFGMLVFLAFALLSINNISAANTFSSTSVSNVRYYSTASTYTAPSGFQYSDLISGINAPENEEEFYDLMVTILPGGCKPMVVRSDLLEEQNVPVFCELTAVKINPGVDISKIAKISVKNLENNPYIAGVGFYPARAAIRSTSNLMSSPVANNIGYAVIVLKRTETENAMPSNITANLSAMFEYDAVNGFGIGVNELYLPVMSDDEFTSRQKEYGFFNGAGYLRVDSIDQDSAVVSIYDSRNRRLFSQRLEKDITSREFRIPTSILSRSYESQAVTLTLKEITMPQTSAKIMVNDGSYVVYKNGKFADKCTLTNVVSSGGGTGTATVSCGGKIITLEKKFNKINLLINGAPGDYALGDKISLLTDKKIQNYYLVYAGNVPNNKVTDTNKKTFIFLAKEKAGNILTVEKSRQIAKNIESQINKMNKNDYYNSLSKIKSSSLFSSDELILVYQGESAKNKSGDDIGITFKEAKFENAVLTSASGGTEEYYKKAKTGYDDVESKFPNELNNYGVLGNTNESFGPLSLWSKYALADKLNQQQDVLEILSEIRNSYPDSKNVIPLSNNPGKTAEQIMADSDNLLSSEGASTFIEDQNLYLELVSVDEPAESEASVEMTYAGIINSQTTTEPTAEPVTSGTGEGVLKIGEEFSAATGRFSLTVKNITKEGKVNISYSCTGKSINNRELLLLPNNIQIISVCDVQVTVREVNYNADEKKSNVSLKIEGRTTLKAGEGIPALFNFKVDSIIKSDDNSFSAKVNFICPERTGDKTQVTKGEEITECGIIIKEITETTITITYKLSSTKSIPHVSSTETTTGTEDLTARVGEKFVDVGNGEVQITLKSFTANKAILTYSCNNSVSNKDIDINLGNTEILPGCEDSQIRVDKINLNEVAKVELNPKIKGRIREANFTFSIGIEKRSDFLLPSPDEMNKQIKDLDETINKWKNATEKLGNLVKGMKAACLATSGALTLKNWATGLSGEAAARHEVMTRQGGWNDICKEQVAAKNYTTENECFQDKNSEIQKSVEETTKIMQDFQKAEEARINANKDATKGVTDYSKVKEDQLNSLRSSYSGEINVLGQDGSPKKMDIGKILQDVNLSEGDASSVDLRELELNLQLINSNVDESLKKSASKKVENLLSQLKEKEQEHVYADELNKKLNVPVVTIGNKNTQEYPYTKQTWSQIKDQFSNPTMLKDTDLVVRIYSQQPITNDVGKNPVPNPVDYLVVLTSPTKTDEKVRPQTYYKIVDDASGKSKVEVLTTDAEKSSVPTNFVFKLYDAAALKNPCKNCDYAEVFNSEPYKGYPSLLPFDDKEGWYVSVRQNIASFGNLKSYQDSGALSSFYLCNVGQNGMMEGDSIDPCENFNVNTADTSITFPGLTASETRTKLIAANNAIKSAQDQLAKNPSAEHITIKGVSKQLKVKGVQGTTGGKCTDFMSPQDCNIMFNVCDPVVCPSSRCDMGGNYRVDDVIQSGIIGSIALCLPNIKEGIFIPICLSGIHAGMEGWISIMQAHRDCLNESLTTNKTIGICDEIYSVYQCDFMWKQIGPYANALAKNALSGTLFGAGTKGGGEYMFVNQAFSNAENSWQYFTSSYASGSTLSFGARSLSEVGSEVCKSKLSATYPDELAAALEPDSPVQIYAFFDETSYSDATVPPTSSYKVYYHIFAGNDNGRYYQVYLKSPSSTSIGVSSRTYSNVDSGYIAKGETIDQTKDFLDNSGFKELCVRIDTKDYCGFKSVTTDFAINYAKDKAIQDQATNQVTTETECVSGSASVGALITPNIQQGVEQAISPDLYNQGIVRVCSSQNPGASVNPARWTEVGYCDNTNIKCWIDGNSVTNAIRGQGIENATLQQINALSVEQLLAEGGMTKEAGENSIKNITDKYPLLDSTTGSFTSSYYTNLEKDISTVYDKMIFSSQKAALLYYKALVYDRIARNLFEKQPKQIDNAVTSTEITSLGQVNIGGQTYYVTSDDKVWSYPDAALVGYYDSENNRVLLIDGTYVEVTLVQGVDQNIAQSIAQAASSSSTNEISVNELENNCWKQVTFSKDNEGYYEVLDGSEVDKETMYIVFDFENKDNCKDYKLSSSKDAGVEEFLTRDLFSYIGDNNYIILAKMKSGDYVYRLYNDKSNLVYTFSLKFNIPQSSSESTELIDASWKTYTLENDFDIKSTQDNKILKNGVYTYVYLKGNSIIQQVDYWFDKSIGSISGGDTLAITDSDINNKYPDLNGGRIIYSKYIQTSTSS